MNDNVRPADWWFPEDWAIVAHALEFAASYAKPEGCPRWRMDVLIAMAERERDRWEDAHTRRLQAARTYRARASNRLRAERERVFGDKA